MTNYEIAKERRKLYHRAMNQDLDTVSSEASDSRSNLELESKSKRNDNKKASSNYKQTRLTHRTDNAEVEQRIILSDSNEENDDDSNNEDADHSESERIMVPSDPSEWNSSHIASWIFWCGRTFSIRPISAILPSTGKELLKLSLRDWQNISGETEGRILARHLGYLHLQATGVHTPDLLQENEDSSADKRGPVEK